MLHRLLVDLDHRLATADKLAWTGLQNFHLVIADLAEIDFAYIRHLGSMDS